MVMMLLKWIELGSSKGLEIEESKLWNCLESWIWSLWSIEVGILKWCVYVCRILASKVRIQRHWECKSFRFLKELVFDV